MSATRERPAVLDRVRPEIAPLSAYHVAADAAAMEVRLDANESPYPPPPELLAALAARVATAALHRYPDPQAKALRALVAADLAQPADRLVFGNGSDDLIMLLCQTFAAPGRDHEGGTRAGCVVAAGPTFVVYRTAAAAAGQRYVEAPLGPRFEADLDALEETIARERPNLVFIATPNNPTGTRWPRRALSQLVAAHPDVAIVIDEAYAAYAGAGATHLDLVARAPQCLVLRTYSKVGLAALRLGVLVAQAEVAAEVEKIRPPYNLGLLPQLAGELALGPFRAALAAHVDEIVAAREALAAALGDLPGVEVFPSAANLILFRVADAPRVHGLLAARSVLVRNLDRPGPLRGCLRVTVGTAAENRRFLDALRDVLRDALGQSIG